MIDWTITASIFMALLCYGLFMMVVGVVSDMLGGI